MEHPNSPEPQGYPQETIPRIAAGSPDFADLVARLVCMPLDHFQRDGCPLEVRVPWLETTLWLVPAEAYAGALAREGITRGRIWTASELMDVLAIPGLSQEQLQTIAWAKAEFGGEVVEVRPRAEALPRRRGKAAP